MLPTKQGYTGTAVPNNMNHRQYPVTYPTARNTRTVFGGDGVPVTPYRHGTVTAPGVSSHYSFHKASNGLMSPGSAGTLSRLNMSGAVPTHAMPPVNGAQTPAFRPMDLNVNAMAQNHGHRVDLHAHMTQGNRKTGIVSG